MRNMHSNLGLVGKPGGLVDERVVEIDPRARALAAIPEPWKSRLEPFIGENNLNLGCAGNKLDGWFNLDKNSKVLPDFEVDLEQTPLRDVSDPAQTVMLKDNSFDLILGSHVFEHIVNFVPLIADLHRILKPGGVLVAVTPYGSSDDAWSDPHHVRCFFEQTWLQMDKAVYETPGHAGYKATQGDTFCSWQILSIGLTPYPEFMDEPDIEHAKRAFRNVIHEMQVAMRAIKEPVNE